MAFAKQRSIFFKVFLPEYCAKELVIPRDFTDYLQEATASSTITSSTGKRTWQVSLVKEGECFSFKDGWEKFVQDNKLQVGEFLIFQYDANSKFTVIIMGTNGCERKCAVGGYNFSDRVKRKERVKNALYDEDSDCVKAAHVYMSQSKHPSFLVSMGPNKTKRYNVHIPTDFVKNHMAEKSSEVQVMVSERTERSWTVTVCVCEVDGRFHQAYLTKGWRKVSRYYYIQEGDTCVFELVDASTMTLQLKMSIFRVTPLVNIP